MTAFGRIAGGGGKPMTGTRVGSIIASTQKEHYCPNGKHKFNCSSGDCSAPYEQNCEAHPAKEK